MTAADDARGPRLRFGDHPLEYLLGAFADVRAGEAPTALLLGLNVLLLLTAYYLLKVVREPLILLGSGAAVKSYAAAGQSALLAVIAVFYGWLSSRVRRLTLMALVSTFFSLNLVVFWALGTHGFSLGIPFFLWVGIFNTVTVAQFWSFAAETYTEEQGKRLFPIVGIGSSVGAIGGAFLAAPLIRRGSPYVVMLIAAGILVASLALTYLVHEREARVDKARAKERQQPLGKGNAFALIARDRYLLVFALLILVLNMVTKTGDYVLDSMLVQDAPARAHALGVSPVVFIGEFKARYFEWINVIGVVMQLFVVSRVIKYAGLRVALVLVPLASVAGYGVAFAVPIITVLLVARVAESSLDYSLSNTARQVLWLVTSPDAKYKAKQVIDTFVMRAGDSLSAALVWIGARTAMSMRSFIAVNAVVAMVWVGLALLLGHMYAQRSTLGPAGPGLARGKGAGGGGSRRATRPPPVTARQRRRGTVRRTDCEATQVLRPRSRPNREPAPASRTPIS